MGKRSSMWHVWLTLSFESLSPLYMNYLTSVPFKYLCQNLALIQLSLSFRTDPLEPIDETLRTLANPHDPDRVIKYYKVSRASPARQPARSAQPSRSGSQQGSHQGSPARHYRQHHHHSNKALAYSSSSSEEEAKVDLVPRPKSSAGTISGGLGVLSGSIKSPRRGNRPHNLRRTQSEAQTNYTPDDEQSPTWKKGLQMRVGSGQLKPPKSSSKVSIQSAQHFFSRKKWDSGVN